MLVSACAWLGSCQLVAGPDLARCEELMMDVENNGRPPLSWRCFCDVHTCRKREAMIWRVPKARANAGGRRCHAGPGFTI